MLGCLNKCYLYWENHSLENLEPKKQIVVENELAKAQADEEYNITLISELVNRRCLGDYLKIIMQILKRNADIIGKSQKTFN